MTYDELKSKIPQIEKESGYMAMTFWRKETVTLQKQGVGCLHISCNDNEVVMENSFPNDNVINRISPIFNDNQIVIIR